MFQAGDVVETDFEGFLKLLRSKTRAFVTIDDHEYYITHTDGYWRVQDCEDLNDGHFNRLLRAGQHGLRGRRTALDLRQEPARQLCGRNGQRPPLPNGQIHRYSRVTVGAAPAPTVFCRYARKSSVYNELIDDSQNSD